ncbi:MAG: DNA gyrase subunit A [delta proteobacterium ML8_D]|jgi:DNA gyrase subunit A|nr:MAG: DNA gyrase subunit A [delta proteobacterium ML8_D]
MVFELRGKVKNIEIESEMQDSYLSYAMSVIIGRALPDVRDGLKPVHRRILYAMSDMGMRHNTPYKKCARIVGEVLGKYHPHGDTAVYDAMVRMAQDFSQRYVLIDGHGNFGSVDGDRAAAMRYTEARLLSIAEELLADIDKDTIEFVDNFDSSLKEPAVLPAKFPNLLVNGSSGIAVGMATNIPPHNLGEIIDGVIHYIDNPEATVIDLMKKVKGPDFPTGGIVMGISGIKEAYETGRGRVVVRGRVHQEQPKKGRVQVIITELPYQVNKANFIEKVAELVRTKKIEGISDLRDESDKSGMRVVLELKKDANPNVIINFLYKNTQLEDTFGVIMLALVDGIPRTLNLHNLIKEYTRHRFDVIVKRTRFELKKAEEREHILLGLLIALDNLDEVIKTIRSSKDVPTARKRLVKNFKLTVIQAQAILDLRLHRLTGLERDKIKLEHRQLMERIKELKKLLENDSLIYGVIKDELEEIKKKYSDERRTDITTDTSDIEIEDLIPEEENVISISHSGYIKRVPVTTYRKQGRGGKGITGTNLKEDDFVKHLFIASTHHYIMFFSNRGKVYRLKVHQIPTGSRISKGKAIVNLLPFSPGEMVAAIIAVKDYGKDEYLIMATKKGMIKKTPIGAYDTSRKDGIIAINIREGDELIGVEKTNGNDEIIMVTRDGKAIRFSEKDCRPMGRASQGVKGMRLSKGDEVLSMMVVREADGDLFVLTENGYGKRTSVSEYKRQKRGGLGVRTIKITEKKGKIAGAGILKDVHDIMVISDKGVLIRIQAKSISRIGRSTQGVRIINLGEGARVASYSIVTSES